MTKSSDFKPQRSSVPGASEISACVGRLRTVRPRSGAARPHVRPRDPIPPPRLSATAVTPCAATRTPRDEPINH